MFACSNDDSNGEASILKTSVENIEFKAGGGKYTVNIESDGNWVIEGNSDWCIVDQKVGVGNFSVIISSTENTGVDERNAFFIIKAGPLSQKVSISQLGIAKGITVSYSELICSRLGESKTFSIETEENWIISDLPYWCSVDKNSGKGSGEVKVTLIPNKGNSPRECVININTKESTSELRIIQSIADFVIEEGGTLNDILREKDLLNSETLVLAGVLHCKDFFTLRDLESLRELDLECVRVEQSEAFDFSETVSCLANSIPIRGFYQSYIRKIKLPNNLEVIGESAFYNASMLGSIEFPTSVYRIESGAFAANYSLKKIVIPSHIKELGDNAFGGCDGLKEVVVEEGISTIESGTFGRCLQLESVLLPNSLKIIKQGAFANSGFSFKKITIPKNVEEIGSFAFAYNGWLNEIHIKSQNPPKLVDSPFWQIGSNCKLYVPKGYKQLYNTGEWSQFTIIEE